MDAVAMPKNSLWKHRPRILIYVLYVPCCLTRCEWTLAIWASSLSHFVYTDALLCTIIHCTLCPNSSVYKTLVGSTILVPYSISLSLSYTINPTIYEMLCDFHEQTKSKKLWINSYSPFQFNFVYISHHIWL